MRLVIVALATSAALLAGALPAVAAIGFTATLDGPQAGVVTPASGNGTFLLRDDGVLEFEISYSGLSSAEIAAHFHGPAASGVSAGVARPLPPGNPKVGSVGPLSAQEQADLLANLWYVNIHTNLYPGGEIRGQVIQSPVSGDAKSWGAIKSLFED